MFEAYFFDKRATINYRVYRVLKALQNTAFTVNKLSQEAQLSYSQTYNAFQDIMADLQTMSPKTVSTADEEAFNILAQNVSVDQYRFHLLNHSMAFAFFDYLFKRQRLMCMIFVPNMISVSPLYAAAWSPSRPTYNPKASP